MILDDTVPCGGMTDMGRLIALCNKCERRTRTVAAPMLPPAQQGADGEWTCSERRFGGHLHKLAPVALSAPPSSGSDGVVSVIRRGNAL